MKLPSSSVRVAPILFMALPCAIVIAAEQPQSSTEPTTTQSADAKTLPPVVVTATRIEQSDFDLPLSIDTVSKESIKDSQPLVNISESLARVPGIVARNRQNYAQDLQISSRGFGARSTFGVRGIRLYSDGIPATMPDGQGQVSHFDLGSASRIEVLRGPFSALYGNSSGGVISLFTEDGLPGFTTEGNAEFGSYGTRRIGIKASGEQDPVNYVLSTSRFLTDGYRDHSAANRNTENAKLRWRPDADSSLTLIGNAVQMRDVQDPLGLTAAQVSANPRAADPSATVFNTRKSIDQKQGGMSYERTLDRDNSLHTVFYTGTRDTIQYQAIPVGAQTPATSAGGVIDLARNYWGTDVHWAHRATLANAPLQWTAGLSFDNLDEKRRGYENFVGTTLGVKGNLRRDESNNVFSIDEYVQAQWDASEQWLLLAGIRNSNVHIRSVDHYIATGNGDDSGSIQYNAVNPVLGATFKASRTLNVYASYGKGFETPTLNELSYRSSSGANTGLNFGLVPAKSDNVEAGVKAFIGDHVRANVAIFHTDTKNELTVLSNTGGRAVYQNAGKTQRDGIEIGSDGEWSNGVIAHLAYALMRAVYAESFCNGPCSPTTRVDAGNRIPGIPNQTLYGELGWRHPASGFNTGLEARYNSKVYVDDVNSNAAAAYVVINLRGGFEQTAQQWRFKEFMRVDNVTDKKYIGSVIVNESNQRFYEPAPGRNYLVGVSASYAWK
jgi:iron complex outermembrane receptor protein